MTPTQKANQYVQQVLRGEVAACEQIKLACKRTAQHFASESDPAFPWYYDTAQADRVCQIIQRFKHVKGKWAAQGKRLVLEPWQCWIVTSLYGWKRKSDHKRKYRRATLVIPRKQGKSLLAAALLIYHLIFDGEFGAECYCGASNLTQAKEIFSAAQRMLINAAELREQTGCEVNAASIVVLDTNSKSLPVIGRPQDGSNVSFAVLDETHQCKTLDLYESFQTGTGAREQPLVISVSTAGFGTENPCRQLQLEAEKVLNGTASDEELFAAIYTIDDGIDWKSDLALRTANPNAGVSVTMDYLRSQQLIAVNNPTKYASFATKHLDVTVAAAKAFYSLEKWRGCTDAITLDKFEGQPCWMGVDLSAKLDLTAIVTVFRREIDGHPHFYAFSDCFAPAEAVANNPLYQQWAARGLIHQTEGNTVSYADIEELILGYADRFTIQEIAFDPWGGTDLFIQTMTPKLPGKTVMAEVPQRATHMSVPMRLLEELTYNRRIHHSGDPVLQFGISNVIPKRFGNLIQPDKEKPEQKIDPAVALMMALSRASVAPLEAKRKSTLGIRFA
jgi:phage terminase large subunit-like protein